MASRHFNGEGIYDGYAVVKANIKHINYLQNNLRDSDVRECMIHGATPFRALMAGIREPNSETYVVIVDNKPAWIFGCNPIMDNMIGKIWLLGTYDIYKMQRKFLRWCVPVVEYFQNKYYQLQTGLYSLFTKIFSPLQRTNRKTAKPLTIIGCSIIVKPV